MYQILIFFMENKVTIIRTKLSKMQQKYKYLSVV